MHGARTREPDNQPWPRLLDLRRAVTRAERAGADAERTVLRYSPFLARFFTLIFAYDLKRSFQAVRLHGALPALDGRPVVCVVNHPSWWDAALFIWLPGALFQRRCFAPMEAAMVAHYPFFERIGAFGVATGTVAGAATFLAASERVLVEPDAMLLVNAQGRFADVRARPVTLSPGLAHLARRVPTAVFLPLAFEYVFWDERRPNALLHFGEPVEAASLAALAPAEGSQRLAVALERTMDRLAQVAIARDPAAFRTLLTGRIGINPVYDAWRRLRALAKGRRFSPAHGDRP